MRLFQSLSDFFNLQDPDWADAVTVLEHTPVSPLNAGAKAATLVLAGSTTTTASTATLAAPATTKAVTATPAIALADHSVLAGANQVVAFSSLFTVGSSTANPAYLIVSGLDRDEYTAGYKTSAMGHLADGSATQGFGNFNGDGWSVGVVFTYQAATGQYTNATFGNLNQLAFDTGSNRGDTATISVFGTSSASLAASYATNPYVLAENPSYFTDYGSVAVLTGASAATPPSTATPDGIVNAALGYVGQAWNDDGCWILASDISAEAGATLPITSTSVGVPGIANGEWFVAYDGPASANGNWVNNLIAGEMVSFQTTSGGGHITTVVSGSGANADLVDNITYVNASGAITDSAHDGSASDIIVQAPHPDMQEFSGVNPATVVVYELDTPVVTDLAASVAASLGATVALSGDLAASDPKPGEGVTQYQVYETNTADTLSVSGTAERTATSAANACTITSLAGLDLTAGAAGADTVEVRASNGSYWGDWTALNVAVSAPVTAAVAIASTGTAPLSVADTAADIGADADKLQALAVSGRLTAVSVTNGALVPLTAGQVTSDAALLHLLPATGVLQVSGATAAQAAALQADAQAASFSIADTAADVSGHTTLGADGKLATITITGTAGGDTLDLTGIKAAASINLSGDSASAVGGLNAAKLAFNGAPDAITLGSGTATITAGLSTTSGITTVANFQFGLDALQLTLGSLPSVQAFNTTYNGAHAVALTGGSYAEGVVLLNQPASVTAASVLASHMHTSGGVTTIS